MALALASGFGLPALAQPAASSVTNTAQLTYGSAGATQTIASNTTTLPITALSTPVIRLMRLAGGSAGTILDASDTQCQMGAGGAFGPVPSTGAETFNPTSSNLAVAKTYQPGDPVFIDVVSPDSNLDPTVRDTIQVTLTTTGGDREVLILRETGPNTGRFDGYIETDASMSPDSDNCRLSLGMGGSVGVTFDDPFNPTDPISFTALVDPFGFVFSSTTGQPVNGATITMIDDTSGKPAIVLGDDGVSAYPSTVISGQTVTDAGGTVYSNRAGEYQFPLAAPGQYHLQITPPAGYSAPSKAPLSQLQALVSPSNGPFTLSAASFGNSFALTAATPLQVDVPLDPHKGGLVLNKSASVTDASFGDLVQYDIKLQNPDAGSAIPSATIADLLPRGVRFIPGSARRDGVKISDPTVSADSRTLTFPLGVIAAGAGTELRYMTRLGADVQTGDAVNQASATDAMGDKSNIAEALIHVHAPLMTDAATIVGRVLEGGCHVGDKDRKGVAGIRILMEDGTYVVTDKDGRYHFEAVRTGLHVVQMDVDTVPYDLEPMHCGRDTRTGGRSFSEFVDLKGASLWRVDFHLRRLIKARAPSAKAKLDLEDTVAAGEGRDWLAGQSAGAPSFLFPDADHNPRAPTVNVVVKHDVKDVVNLTVNGARVDPLLLDSDTKSADGQFAAIFWRGVPLHDGDNALVATITDGHGALIAKLTRAVHYANTPAMAQFVPERSRLIADGLTRPAVAVRILDRAGKPVRAGTMGTFSVLAPYASAAAQEAMQKRQLSGLDGQAPRWRVTGDDGVALIELAPTSQAGEVVVNLPMPGDGTSRPTKISAWLSADREKWVIVGFSAGTLGFDTLSRHADPLQRQGGHADMADGQLAFYAKGRIRGDWLLTIAYDNKKTIDQTHGLLGAIDPDKYYTVYGDGTAQGYDAASQRKLYLRLERKQFYALFGDFRTGFDSTELGRYNRTLNGFKFERQGKVINVSGFAAQTDQAAIRDEIQGQGISGPYRLSHHDVTPNTDQVTLETRDRARSERVLSSQPMTLHVDYDIDNDNGLITFKSPVLSTDANLNPNVIVIEYEVQANGEQAVQAGLRASANLLGDRVKIGATLLHDGQKQQVSSGDVIATDFSVKLRPDTQLKLEVGVSDPNAPGLRVQTAYLAEIEHKSANLELLGYVRQEDAAYGLSQQSAEELGAQKEGLDAKMRLGAGFSVSATGYHETFKTNAATRDALDARIDYTLGDWKLNAGIKVVSDETLAGGADSDLLTFGATRDFLDHKLQLTGSTDVAIGKAESVDFPAKDRLGASYALNDNVRLVASDELVEGATYTAQTFRIGTEIQPWKGGHFTTGLDEQDITENGPRTFAQLGLTQTVALSKQWSIDGAIDSSTTLAGKIPTSLLVNPAFPTAAGGTTFTTVSQTGAPAGVIAEDFKSVSLGATYHAEKWSWTGRAEVRLGETADTWNVRTSWLRQLDDGVVAAIAFRANQTQALNDSISAAAQIDGSLAWRPLESRWSVLDKLTLREDDAHETAEGEVLAGFGALAVDNGSSRRIVNSLAVNYDTGAESEHGRGQWQVSVYYGAKYVDGHYDDDTYTGFVDVTGLQGRVDLSSSVDLGLNLSVEHAWSDHNVSFAFGPSVGVSPVANTWISIGWNVIGFRDQDFQDTNYSQQGPYITARLKFDQLSLAPLIQHLRGDR